MTGEGRYRLVLLLACLLLFSYNLGGRDFWDPDEPRYVGITRGILESGDWLNLSDNGRPYTDKPPLYFWIQAIAARVGGGVTALDSRIPNSLLALLTVFLIYGLGKDLFQARVGLFGALVLATSQRFFLEARWVHTDMLLTCLVVVSLASAYRALESGKGWRWTVAYLAAGAGCLVKGPVALAVPVLAMLVFLASVRELPRHRETRWWYGMPAALVPVLGWLLASSLSSGFDPLAVVRTQIFQRFQEGVHHPRPFYYYLYSLPLEFLPWTPFLAGALVSTFPGPDRKNRRPIVFLYAWVLGGLALFSLAAEKRPSYVLPLLPPLALLTGIFLDDFLVRWEGRSLGKWVAGALGLCAAACFGGILWLPHGTRAYPGLGNRLLALGIFYLVVCAASLTALLRGRRGACLAILLAGVWAGYLGIAGSLMPWLNPYKSARPFCERIVSRIGASRLGIYGDYRPAFAFYTRRHLDVLRTEASLEAFLDSAPPAYCLLPREKYEALRGALSLEGLERGAVGHRSYVLVAGPGDGAGGEPPR